MFSIVSSISSVITKRTGISIEPCPDPGPGDLLWYKFDNTNGVDNASSGQLKNYAGTQPSTPANALIGTPTLNANSIDTNQTSGFGSVTIGSGLKYITCPSTISMALPRTNGFTISCWLKIPSSVKTTPTSGLHIPIFCLTATGTNYWERSFSYAILKSTATEAYISCLSNERIYYPIDKFYDDQWHLHTVTLNSGTSNLIKFYFDGVLLGTSTGGTTPLQNYTNSSNGNAFGYLTWGGNSAEWVVPPIQYADIRIYKTELSASKIRGLYRDTANNHP